MLKSQIINDRLRNYEIKSIEDEENALKEILQEIALYALSTTDFFTHAMFHGGTSLRILYHLPRFSEDLDFILKTPNSQFRWEPYIEKMNKAFELFGVEPEIMDRGQANKTIQKMFLKDNSIGKIINLQFKHHAKRKLLIKLEIDTNPPMGSTEAIKFLDFPLDSSILTQDLPSNFAGKCHALLCRQYLKGRDWFDFSWYVAGKTQVNFNFLTAAINQAGPWQQQNINISNDWLITQLSNKINSIHWKAPKLEVSRFINKEFKDSLDLWSTDFFLDKVHKLQQYLRN